MVKVSVIVPVYNVEDYLRRCLDSIINQTLEDIEIICINDGSTDSSLEILNEYSKIDNRIIVYTQENQGLSGARNSGIKLASGEYYYFIDPDDWIELECLDKLYWHAIHNNSDIVLFNFVQHHENNELKERIYLPIDKNIDYTNFVFDVNYNKILLVNNIFVVWSKFFKASLIKDNNIKFQFRLFEDVAFHVETLILAKRISYIPEILYHYNKINQNSLQNKNNDTNKRLIIFEIFKSVERILREYDYYEEYKIRFNRFKIAQCLSNLKMINDDEFKDEFYKKSREEFLKMGLTSKILEKLPFKYYQYYVYVITFKNYDQYNSFNQRGKYFDYIYKPNLDSVISNFKELGINKKNPQPIIISLTSFPERMYDIHYCLYSLLTQTLKPKKVILWLSEEQFPKKEKDIPENVLKLKKNGLSIKWCKDIKSYKKLIPALKKYPNDYIVTADDDLFYSKDWLKQLWLTHEKYPDTIISSRARQVSFDDEGNLNKYKYWELIRTKQEPSYLNFPTNGAGTLFYPNCFTEDVLNEELFLKICPTADDIWFWTMAILNKTKITCVEEPYNDLCYINITRQINILDEYTLWEVNKEGNNDVQLNNILNHFPKIKENLYED